MVISALLVRRVPPLSSYRHQQVAQNEVTLSGPHSGWVRRAFEFIEETAKGLLQ